jgi:hypothetical protein
MTTRLVPAFVIFALALTGCSGKKDGEKKDGDTGPKPLGKADFTMKSEEFGAEFKGAGAIDARKKYANKVVELTGTLNKIGLSPDRLPILYLQNAAGENLGVTCTTTSKEPWKKALPGQTVTVKGKESKLGTGAGLEECEIVEVKGDAKTMTANELQEEHAKDLDASIKKYDNKMLVVEGEVARIDVKDNYPEITLKTAKETPRIYLNFTEADRKRAKEFKVGQKVKAMGEYTKLNADKDSIGLFNTIIIDPAP